MLTLRTTAGSAPSAHQRDELADVDGPRAIDDVLGLRGDDERMRARVTTHDHGADPRARGEADEDSDLDLLVVIDSLSGAERREIAQQSGDAISDWGVPLSPFPMSTEHFAELRARERLIVSEIERDGIPL